MAEKQYHVTAEGLRKLEEEYEYLTTVKRLEISDRIKVALGFGDLSENAEYDEAKNEQAQVEARIAEIEAIRKFGVIIDESDLSTEIVKIGAKVKILDIEFDEEMEYQVIGSTEADPNKGSISDESPVGKALLGHKAGDIVSAETPGGIVQFKILAISR